MICRRGGATGPGNTQSDSHSPGTRDLPEQRRALDDTADIRRQGHEGDASHERRSGGTTGHFQSRPANGRPSRTVDPEHPVQHALLVLAACHRQRADQAVTCASYQHRTGLSPCAGPTCRCAGSVQGNQCCPGLSLPSTGRRPCPLRARLNGEPESSAATHGQSQYPLTCIAAALLSRRRSLPSWSYQPRAGPWVPHPHQAIRLPLSPLQHGRGDRFARQGQVLAAVEP